MNLLCPNCNKMLTVPEQYAGQLMKCPLCGGTFTVPNMPAFGGPEMAPAFDAPAPPASASAPPTSQGTYGPQPDAAPAFQTAAPPAPPAAPEPAFSVSPPPAPPAPPPTAPTTTPSSPPSVPPATPGGYTTRLSLVFSDKVLQWVPPVCILLIFILLFFPWVGIYPGGVPAMTQTAWGVAFGGYTQDKDMKNLGYYFPDSKELDEKNKAREEKKLPPLKDHRPGWDILQLFYLFPFFVLTLAASAIVVGMNFMKLNLPPAVQQLLPWRWAILFGLSAILLLFLTMQVATGFPIESNYKEQVKEHPTQQMEAKTTLEEKKVDVHMGTELAALRRTYALRLVVALHVIATICAGLVYWIERRGPGKPLPRVDLMW